MSFDSETLARPGRVLIVEDEPAILRGYALRLREVDHEVVEAPSLAEALAALSAEAFDVVVADVHMPGGGGLDLLAHARRRHPDVAVVLMSADPTLESALAALDLGVLAYLLKPVSPQRLRECVGGAIPLARLARARRSAREVLAADTEPTDRDAARFGEILAALYVCFQPIVRWPGGAVVAYEALLRTDRPPGFGPAEVLALAERVQGVASLGRTVRARVAEALPAFDPSLRMFVNVHACELLDEQLYDPRAPLSHVASRVTLELTERAAFDTITDLSRRVGRLRGLGYQVAIDDLGAGYSGLSSLVALQPEVVKVDMQLVRGLHDDPPRKQLVGALLTLTRQMGITLVAEGVETTAERDCLAHLGGELMQGWLFGRPGPAPA